MPRNQRPHYSPCARPCPHVAHLYGPAARCKPKVMIWRSWVLRFCIRPLNGTFVFWPSWISARARSHSRLGLEGHMGHLITNALARPFLHLLIPTRRPRRESQLWLLGSARAVPSEPPSLARPIWRATGGDRGRRPSPW